MRISPRSTALALLSLAAAACSGDDGGDDTDVVDAGADVDADNGDTGDASLDSDVTDASDEPDAPDVTPDADAADEPDVDAADSPDADVVDATDEPDLIDVVDEVDLGLDVPPDVDVAPDVEPPACTPDEGVEPQPLTLVAARLIAADRVELQFSRPVAPIDDVDPEQFRLSAAVGGVDGGSGASYPQISYADAGYAMCSLAYLAYEAGIDSAPFYTACEANTDPESGDFLGLIDVTALAATADAATIELSLSSAIATELVDAVCAQTDLADYYCGIGGLDACIGGIFVHYAPSDAGVFGAGDCTPLPPYGARFAEARAGSEPERLFVSTFPDAADRAIEATCPSDE
ncbi:MAG: hypothetical protein H6700_03605 [Myxococcales bacterium]|nr:hypothetical protein [Myxococcales bacterium]MCB9530827.1 hypothetical protein [Myxococcales bacterium]